LSGVPAWVSSLLAVAFKFVSAMGAETVTLETLGRALIVAEVWGFKIGLAFFALGSLLYGILFVSTGAVPRALGWWGADRSVVKGYGDRE